MTAAELILRKALVAADLDSSQWNRVQAGFRNRAFFSSRVAEINILAAMRGKVAEYAKGETDLSKIRMRIREDLAKIGYAPEPGKEGTIHDLFSEARLNAIVKTNVAQAHGYLQHIGGMSPGAFAAFPAQEFTRVRHSRKPRGDWPERWRKAGGRLYGGRMIALKDDPVWERLSVFGNPFPPFDWGSGMGVLGVAADEAEKLGVIDRAGIKEKTAELRKKPVPDFNANLQAALPVSGEHYPQQKAIFGDFGDLVRVDGGMLKWRPEILSESVLCGKNFVVRLGQPQKGLLSLLRADPKLAYFADAIEGKNLNIDQSWLQTKRPDGTTHDSHFYPDPKNPKNIPLRPEDFEMLPCMWRKPDRALKLTRDRFLLETDAFDGGTYMMQVGFNKNGTPKLWTFFKTVNPTSKKAARYPAIPPPDAGRTLGA